MIQHREAMPKNCDASLKCLQNKAVPYTPLSKGNSNESLTKPNDKINTKSTGDVVQPSRVFHKSPTYVPDFGRWSTFQNCQPCLVNVFGSHVLPSLLDNPFPYAPFSMSSHGYPNENQFQEFQYFVVIDFEATCDKEKIPSPQEIIEFPSVIVSSVTGQVEACFQTYVRPTYNQLLTDFCKDLTGIQQIQVDTGVPLSEAINSHDRWLEHKGVKNANFIVVTWSNWDCGIILESECQLKKIKKPAYFNRWINLKVPFREVFGGGRTNLKEAVQKAGLTWEGRPHCGLDDAKNTAHLLALMMHNGFKFCVTNSLMEQTADCSFTCKKSPELMHFSSHQPHKQRDQTIPMNPYHPNCFCGFKSIKWQHQNPGSKGRFFYGCGNWTGIRCHYFKWASA